MFLDIFNSSHYVLNPYAVPSLLTALATVVLSIRLLITERFSQVALLLALDGIAITIWLASNFFVYSGTEETLPTWWARASYLGIPFIPTTTYHFAVAVLRIGKKNNKILWAAWILSALFSVASITTDLVVGGVILYPWGYSPKIAPLNIVLMLYMLTIYGLSLRHLWIGQKEAAPNSAQSKRIKAFLTAFGIGSFGFVDYLAGAGIPVYPFGFLGIFVALWILYKTVRKYRLVDITPRFAAQSIIDTMNDALLVLDAEGIIRLVNNATTRVLGHPEPQLVGCHVSTIFDSSSALDLLANPAGLSSIHNLELPYDHPDGSKRVVSLSASLMQDENKSPLAHVYITRDITTIRQAEAEIIRARDELELRVEERSAELRKANEQMLQEINERKKVEEELSRIFNLVPDMIAVISSSGHFKKLNPAWKKALGFAPEEMLSKPVFDFIHPDDIAPTVKEVEGQIRGKTTLNFVNRYRCKDGTYKWLEWAAFASHDRELLFGAARDITERKKMEEELFKTQKLESMGVLAGGIAHDFNNILTAILGNISLVRMQIEPGDKLYKHLEESEKASVRAKDLTQQLLTFSKGGSPIKKATALDPVIRDAVSFALRGANILPEFRFAEGLWPVEADEGQLGQVFNNLVINSCQAMPGGGTLQISAENKTVGEENTLLIPGGKYVRITVKDHGIGIQDEHLERIFDPYFTTKQRGSGLGLAVTYSIIRNHCGCISVDSKPDAGAIFTIHLPAAYAAAPDQKVAAEHSVAGTGRVLIMDDEDIVRDVACSLIKYIGYDVEAVKDGAEAIAAYKKAKESSRPFDAVIMDLTIPGGMGGKEAIAKLREIDPGIKAIVSSGYSNDPIMASHGDYGFKEVIAKPYTIANLGNVLQKVIAG